MNPLLSLISLLLIFGAPAPQQIPAGRHCVEPGKGQFLILVGKSGLFSAFAHDHTVEAKEITGCAEVNGSDLARSSVELTFPAGKIVVLDPNEAKDRPKVQETMETEVLQVQKFPSIRFRSTAVRPDPKKPNAFIVDGQLTIRDRTQPVAVPAQVSVESGLIRARGEYTFRQTAFGIKPVRVAGGTVSVKDELKVRFDLYLK